MHRLKLCTSLTVALTFALMSACSPALDWREVRPDGGAVVALFPCKPKSQSRSAPLAGAPVPMTLLSCDVEAMTFALSHADLADPTRVTPAAIELRRALAANLGAVDVRTEPVVVPGMTPNAEAVRIRVAGHLPDGSPVNEQAALFVRGTRVYQAVVLGARLDASAADVFFENLRFAP